MVEQKMHEFRKLDVNQKKEKLLAIFNYAKDNIDFSERAITYLTENDTPNELIMENLYMLVVQAVKSAKERHQEDYKQQRDESSRILSEKALKAHEADSADADELLGLINLI